MIHQNSFFDSFTQDPEFAKSLHQAETVLEVTEMICELMEIHGITRSRLATLLGTTKGYVSQLLDGETNMTLKTLADVLFALGCRMAMKAVKAETGSIVYESNIWPEAEYAVNQLDPGWIANAFDQHESLYVAS
jgi:transcriptional regulator with XRE-family HTH domain